MSTPSPFGAQFDFHVKNHLTHQLHTSERKAFRACRRRWNWVYNDMYDPHVTAEPLEFGVAFHASMESLYQPAFWDKPIEPRLAVAMVTFRRECEKHLKRYKKLNPDPDVEVLNSYKERIHLGIKMLEHYVQNVMPSYDKNWTPIRVEQGFEVPIRHPETGQQLYCKCDRCWKRYVKWNSELESGHPNKIKIPDNHRAIWMGLPVTYGGRLDALFQDNHGRYWVADWKTTSRFLDEDQESSFLQLDDQIVSYLWALSQYGINCAGFVYVEIKKSFPQAPKLLTRKYKGRLVSTDRSFMSTPELFKATVLEHDNDGWQMGLYDDHLAWLAGDGSRFTQRHQIHKNLHEIAEAGKTIALEALDIIDPNLRIYPQPGRFSCNWCLFRQPCLGVNMGEDYEYTLATMFEKRTMMYWEEKESSTE